MESTTNKLTVYIAGPMRGYKNSNFPAFFDAARKWSNNPMVGRVFNPAQMDEDMGYDGDCVQSTQKKTSRCVWSGISPPLWHQTLWSC